jgi:hypothetical protein
VLFIFMHFPMQEILSIEKRVSPLFASSCECPDGQQSGSVDLRSIDINTLTGNAQDHIARYRQLLTLSVYETSLAA